MKSKDTQFAAVKLPKCLERPHNSTKNSRMHTEQIGGNGTAVLIKFFNFQKSMEDIEHSKI